jgi:XTP/dITP diphosphohydrolase
MQLVIATSNQHKADEISKRLPGQFEIVLQSELGVESPEETGTSFVENALIKAKNATRLTGMPALADDSGLCVDALGGRPGIHSARFAGTHATDRSNILKLLAEMDGIKNRKAAFHCVLVYVASENDPVPLITQGRWSGEISINEQGDQGFGYDPIFFLPEQSKTAAQLSPGEKNAISHRGLALRSLAKKLDEQYPS